MTRPTWCEWKPDKAYMVGQGTMQGEMKMKTTTHMENDTTKQNIGEKPTIWEQVKLMIRDRKEWKKLAAFVYLPRY